MTPSPYQAASTDSSLNTSTSDRDARRSSMDWPQASTPATHNPIATNSAAGSEGPSPGTRSAPQPPAEGPASAANEAAAKLAMELNLFTKVADKLRSELVPAKSFKQRCQQAFDVANDLFGNAPTWVCFYRELLSSRGMLATLFEDESDRTAFQESDQHTQIQGMLTALRSRDLPENDPNDPQRMITVRLPKSLHEAMCDEAKALNISINKLCISRLLQLLDPAMIPETTSKPRGRKPRTRSEHTPSGHAVSAERSAAVHSAHSAAPQQAPSQHPAGNHQTSGHPSENTSSRGFDFSSTIRRP